ncbi:hypothetical protein CNMCM8927_002046 [Aspergillus lentulus]|uniref:Uncharacterized protein n=1 Tax=Aspergillus lentulus TaxID=293939 RepID=A0AAN5YI59_ASPLE|nr:hypothetical protein CNMCM6069_007956 [Aspergillus lentulus]KAF4201063.1 hypothetical protein CNMCM8927_002046 [Aspergillus lentulus]
MPSVLEQDVAKLAMAMTSGPKPPREDECFEAMITDLKPDATFWSGGDHYGSRQYNSLHLLNKYFSKYPEKANDAP